MKQIWRSIKSIQFKLIPGNFFEHFLEHVIANDSFEKDIRENINSENIYVLKGNKRSDVKFEGMFSVEIWLDNNDEIDFLTLIDEDFAKKGGKSTIIFSFEYRKMKVCMYRVENVIFSVEY